MESDDSERGPLAMPEEDGIATLRREHRNLGQSILAGEIAADSFHRGCAADRFDRGECLTAIGVCASQIGSHIYPAHGLDRIPNKDAAIQGAIAERLRGHTHEVGVEPRLPGWEAG